MTNVSLRRTARLALVLLSVGFAAGCEDEATTPAGGLPKNLAPGIYSLFSVAGQGGGVATVQLHLERVQVPGKIASYQGELTYDTGVLTLKEAELPEGVIGSAREISPGRVRFAGATPDGLEQLPALTMRFARRGEIRRETFKLNIEEVADEDFGDLTSKVSSGAPFFEAR
ncbi:MAG TPA: hypothetical protein VFQ45_10250 [Longimicrobium sp.]|nr:hypothetical protein [Longimicrobium sp.]